ncbi:hypothetical protein C2E23DRAFT_787100 [Lenzites betulinus]|nr:hypothetical protein C2E23DRAFT_787100 [Lenzites betulinus]
MSISTCSYCTSSSYSSGMATIQSTPRRLCGQNIAKSHADVLQASRANQIGWEGELSGRILSYGRDVNQFIDDLVPCSTPFTRNDNLSEAFSNYQPGAGREVQECPNVASGFAKLVRPFPDGKRVIIEDSHSTQLNFPFDAFKTHHHPTFPDISVSFPGQPLYRAWQSISMVVECKGDDSQDPFQRRGNKHMSTVEQLAKNARNILLAHGALAAFVISVYGHTVRLARFDHTCALVSPAFTIDTDAGKKTLQKFLWHFVHPVVGGVASVVGSDPTVMKLTQGDREWIKKELERAHAKDWQKYIGETLKGRRIEVYDEKTGRCVPYLLYHLVDVNARLFSRATMVWRAIEDRRTWRNGSLVEDPTCTTPVKPRTVKEAWRQLVRIAEAKFYQRLSDRIDDSERVGLAKMVCGGDVFPDVGEFELWWWKETTSRQRVADTNTASTEAPSSSGPSTPRPSSQLFCSTGSSASPIVTSVDSPSDYIPSNNFPLGHPQHQTYSWRLVFGEKTWHRERSHMRMVIDDVGRPLIEFTSTRELVLAICDAIMGHKQAWEKAQLLHRDISVGNILIADEPKTGGESSTSYTGFLHDYDYSSMEPDPPKEELRTASQDVAEHSRESNGSDGVSEKKERTVFFLMYEILKKPGIPHEIHHDLESYYWVLLWVVVRHTDHGNDEDLCDCIFKYGNDQDSANAKYGWLEGPDFVIKGNKPLTYLFAELKRLVLDSMPTNRSAVKRYYLTHDALLEAFQTALAMPEWPPNDWCECRLLDKNDGRTGIAPIITSGIEDQLNALTSALPQLHRPVNSEGHPRRPKQSRVRKNKPAPHTLDNPELFLSTTKKRGLPAATEGFCAEPSFSLSGTGEHGAESRPSKRLRTDSMGPPTTPPAFDAIPGPATRVTRSWSRRGGASSPERQTRSSSRQREIEARKMSQGEASTSNP